LFFVKATEHDELQADMNNNGIAGDEPQFEPPL
jgi:hypothetical protein